MKKTLSLFLAFALCCSSLLIPSAIAASDDITGQLELLANETINKTYDTNDGNEQITYSNIDSFIDLARHTILDATDLDIAKFILQYTGQTNEDKLPDNIILETLDAKELISNTQIIHVAEDGTQSILSETEAAALPYASFDTTDGYLRLTTIATYDKLQGSNKYYTISATATWLKFPGVRGEDVLVLTHTGVYDDTYTPYGYSLQSYHCNNGDSMTTDHYMTGSSSSTKIEFASNATTAFLRFSLGTPYCSKDYSHSAGDESMSSYYRYRILVGSSQAANVQTSYSHMTVSAAGGGKINVKVGPTGFGVTFSGGIGVMQQPYNATPITINT